MKTLHPRTPLITSNSILAGIGSLKREEICSFIAMLEKVDGLSLAKGALEDLGRHTRILDRASSAAIDETKLELVRSATPDALLRHRLWVCLAKALKCPTTIPLSPRSTSKAASALAVRASERLSPSVIAERNKKLVKAKEEDLTNLIGTKAAELWNAGRCLLSRKEPLPFPDLVREELLNFLADKNLVSEAKKQADPAVEQALSNAHVAAQKVIAAGGGWVAFATLVGNAGFLPYILAAQLSAWIPLVSGPALVSLLATLINPLTVLAGVSTLGWLALGKGSQVLRSQVAARICVLLALPGSRNAEDGLEAFVADMRSLDQVPSSAFDYLSNWESRTLEERLSVISVRSVSSPPMPAGPPPQPWDMKREMNDVNDAEIVASLTAGEMVWHAAAMDENVLKAADFSRAADLGDPLSFSATAQDFALEGAGYSLRGYTAERLVLDKLVADGHDVKLAATSNAPGLDLIVDGLPVQVKCGTELSNLSEHFDRYPDIPVIANKELLDQAHESGQSWAHMVTTLPGFEIENLESEISEALGHAANLADPSIIEFALSMGALRGGIEVMRGRIPVSDLPTWLLMDGASRGVLGIMGMKAGGWIGLVAIGPAGALVLGPAIGCAALLGNSAVKTKAQNLLMAKWLRELLDLGLDLHSAISAALERRIRHLNERTDRLNSAASEPDELSVWITNRSLDDVIFAIEELADIGAPPKNEQACIELLFKAADLAPADATVLRASQHLNLHFAQKPRLQEMLVDNQLEAFNSILQRKVWTRFRA